MESTWDSSFKPFFYYTIFSSLPPYTYSYKIGYLSAFGTLLFLVRSIPLLLTIEEGFAEMFFMIALSMQMLLRSSIFLWKRKTFEELSKEINKFMQDNKIDPIIQEEDYFLNIWKKNFVFKNSKWFIRFLVVLAISWQFPIYYDMVTNLENAIYPYYPLYSPYFEYNIFTKVFYTVMDIMLDWNAISNVIQNEIVFMSLSSFLHCQYLYLKELLDEICFENENDPEKMKWWIQNHCSIIRFRGMMQNLLAPVIAINYIGLIAETASCIVVVSDVTVQSLFQKYVLLILYLVFLFEIGSHCNTMDKINIVNKTMHENMNPFNARKEKLEVNTFYRMIDFMSKKPVQLYGPGFFTLNSHEFKNLVYQTYSFYSSLISFKKK